MKVMLYSSKHGFTRELLEKINKEQGNAYHLVPISEIKKIDLNEVDEIIIGGSLYHSIINKELIYTIESQIKVLMQKRVILFLVGLKVDQLQKAFELNFPKCLLDQFPRFYLGGNYDETKVKGIEAFQLKRIKKKVHYVDNGAIIRIEQLVNYLNQ